MFSGPMQLRAVLHILRAQLGSAVVFTSGAYEQIVASGLAGLEHHRAVCVEVGPAGAEVPDRGDETQGVCAQMRIPGGQAYVVFALDCAELAPVDQ